MSTRTERHTCSATAATARRRAAANRRPSDRSEAKEGVTASRNAGSSLDCLRLMVETWSSGPTGASYAQDCPTVRSRSSQRSVTNNGLLVRSAAQTSPDPQSGYKGLYEGQDGCERPH